MSIPTASSASRNPPLDLLRAALTLLVVAHHSVLAYHPQAPSRATFTGSEPWWSAFPVVDPARWPGSAVLVLFDETFFMALFFLVSGLFVWPSLARSGPAAFLRSRALRLGLPFVLCAGLLAPLAYTPSYLQAGGEPGLLAFVRAWLGLGIWPAGPAWFLWVLLAFDVLAAAVFALAPRVAPALGERLAFARDRSFRAFLLVAALGLAAYVPVALAVNPMSWWSAGPLYLQTSRLGLYLAWFGLGCVLGSAGLENGLLAAGGRLARTSGRWITASGIGFILFVIALVAALRAYGQGAPSTALDALASATFALSCAATSFAALAVALRFGARWAGGPVARALSRDAFGIYVLHYAAVSWAQYALLPAALPGVAKAAIVFAGATAVTWGASAAGRTVLDGLRRQAPRANSAGQDAFSRSPSEGERPQASRQA